MAPPISGLPGLGSSFVGPIRHHARHYAPLFGRITHGRIQEVIQEHQRAQREDEMISDLAAALTETTDTILLGTTTSAPALAPFSSPLADVSAAVTDAPSSAVKSASVSETAGGSSYGIRTCHLTW